MAGLEASNKLSFLGVTSAPRIERGGKATPVEEIGYVEPVNYNGENNNGNLVGVNTNISIGDYQDGPTQAGYKLGGRTIAFG